MDKRKRRLLCMLEGSGRKSRWISGAPPLSYKALAAGTLENYRIYGNTVDGESVGDLVESGEHAGEYKVPVTVEGKNLFDSSLGFTSIVQSLITGVCRIPVTPGETYTSINSFAPYLYSRLAFYNQSNQKLSETSWGTYGFSTGIAPENAVYVQVTCRNLTYGIITDEQKESISKIMVVTGSTVPEAFEPYQTPVTTPIYLPEQIRKVGDEAEYIDYSEQKQHRIGADDLDVTLPALPTLAGTNTLSVGTEVQPSEIEVKGKIKAL